MRTEDRMRWPTKPASPCAPAAGIVAEGKPPVVPIWLAQLASQNANNSLTVEGPVISLTPRHAKVRREGYRR
jgi:hypothetical protein